MDLEIFDKMEAPELKNYIQFLLWHYRVMDSFWFLYVRERFDQPTAERINEQVWGRVASVGAKILSTASILQRKGSEGLSKP